MALSSMIMRRLYVSQASELLPVRRTLLVSQIYVLIGNNVANEVKCLSVLLKHIVNNRVVQMNISWVLITCGYTVTGHDSSVHDLCRAHDSRNDLLRKASVTRILT